MNRPLSFRPQFCRSSREEGGDCYRACIATITGFDASDMPNFQHLKGVANGYDGLAHAKDWLAAKGLTIFDTWVSGQMTLEQVLGDCSEFNKEIPIILSGWTDSGNDCHAVVILNGQIVHDPSGSGVDRAAACQCGKPNCTRTDWGLQIIVPLIFENLPLVGKGLR